MKTTYKPLFWAVALAAMASFIPQRAPADILLGWSAKGLANWGPSPWAPTTNAPNLDTVGWTRGSGVSTNNSAAANGWGGTPWGNTESSGIGSNLFATLSVTPAAGFTVSFTSISAFHYRRSGTGPSSASLQVAINGGAYNDVVTGISFPTNVSSGGTLTPIDLSAIASLQNVTGGNTVNFRLVPFGATGSSGTFYIYNISTGSDSNDFEISGTLTGSAPPENAVVTPASETVNYGGNASFALTFDGGPASIYWYFQNNAGTSLIPNATNTTLNLTSLNAGNDGQYFAVVSNTLGKSTSAPVTLMVIDPAIVSEPSSTFGLEGKSASFTVGAIGTGLTYQWYFADNNSNVVSAVANGVTSYSGSTISGAQTATLSLANINENDPTNFLVVVTGTYGSVTSSVASLVAVGPQEPLVFWNFNGPNFTNQLSSPPPYYGIGTASAVNVTPISGAVDPQDGAGLPGYGLGGPPYQSWGTQNYPAQGTSNKTAGIQFMTSTAGARNITISYDARGTGTASAYERLQYTTNGGTAWNDYPTSTSFGTPKTIDTFTTKTADGVTGYTTSTYAPFGGYDLSGIPGVDNNPNFGIRIVTEWESTATYGASPNNNYYGISNTNGPAGTLTYDLVTINGEALTNSSAPPTIASLPNTNMYDYQSLTLNFTVGDTANSPANLQLSATSGNPNIINPSLTLGGSGANRTITINPNVDQDGTAPIIITATDPTTGLLAKAWFDLAIISLHRAPTNSLVNYPGTNTLVNVPVSLPFTASADTNAQGSLSYSATSGNQNVIPSGNITFNTNTPGAPVAIINPGSYMIGAAPIGITVNDNDPTEPRSTTANFMAEVLPNTNVVLIDYFNYDNSGPLDTVASGFWTHLSGNSGQMQVGTAFPGYVLVDTLDNTENLQAKLLGAPYTTNSSAVLYASFIVMVPQNGMPIDNGSYFGVFNDGSGVTGPYSCRIMCATNQAAPGYYRLGVNNSGADATSGVLFPQDLAPGSNYVVVTRLVLSNGFSTMWVSPASQSSPSVTDTVPAGTLYNVSAFELRESGAAAGQVYLTKLKVGTTFDSVFPSLHVANSGNNVIVSASDPTLPVESSVNVSGPYLNAAPHTPFTNQMGSTMFFRFGQTGN